MTVPLWEGMPWGEGLPKGLPWGKGMLGRVAALRRGADIVPYRTIKYHIVR